MAVQSTISEVKDLEKKKFFSLEEVLMKKNYYDVLNLAKSCSAKEIKDSFIKLSKKYHPDLNSSHEAHKKFIEINEAYEVLGKRDSRKSYDKISQRRNYGNEDMMYPNSMRGKYETYYDIYNRQQMNSHYDFTSSSSSSSSFSPNSMNFKISSIVFCCVFITVGAVVHTCAMRKRIERNTQLAAKHLQEARARAELRRIHNLPLDDMFRDFETAQNHYNKNFEMEK